ncbi:acetolactate synthase small subunit [Methanobacterium congolense]|jgi:acetolactate synthase-1/3 small subunit|uniref:Acetolactate synthase small subunit n=1 Tax=Methanobacterium congolense TaxID=118062 RepID=A0A1D3L5N1_9EURY|nr:acetolactate synthase small subunit [Methanobacterium congolense]SCG86892.1 putative acetolactate synthase small subunit [Methanobacterium congolense]
MEEQRTHIISALVLHKPGVLQRVAGLFTRRGFNIENITVGTSQQKDLARMTIIAKGDEKVLEQITKQLNKLIEVIKVRDLDPESTVERELCLIKVHTPTERVRSEVIQYANIFRGRIIDVSPENITIEITGDPDKIEALIDLLRTFGIKEIARTGPTAMSRGNKTM